MKRPVRITIRGSLLLMFGLLLLSSLAVFVVGRMANMQVEKEVVSVTDRAVQLQQKVEHLRYTVSETQRLSMQGVMLEDQSQLFRAAGESLRFFKLVDEITELLRGQFAIRGNAQEMEHIRGLVQRLEILRDRYEIYLQAVMSLSADMVEGMEAQAGDEQTIARLQREFSAELDEIHNRILGLVKEDVEGIERTYRTSELAAWGGLVFMIVVIATAMMIIRRYWTKPMQVLQGFVVGYGKDVSGDRKRLEYLRNDEIGDLCRAINLMLDNIDQLTVSRNHLESVLSRLKVASEAKSLFLSSMSHELRTPLNAVIGYAQMLESEREDITDDEYVMFVSNIIKSGQHLLTLVDDVLDLEKIEAGKMSVKLEKVNLEYVVNECLILIASQADGAGITLVNNVPVHEQYPVMADPGRLRQVLINLVSNGIKYNRPGGSVTIDIGRDDNVWCISIADTGTGMSDEDIAGLFQPFERLGFKNSDIQGSGIGLVISRQLMYMMGGDISVSSRLGEGSCFQIRIPVRRDVAATQNSAVG